MGNISGNPRITSNYVGYLWRDNGWTIVNIYPRRSAWILNTLNDLTFLLDQPLFLTGSYCGKPLALIPCWFGSPSGMENLAVSCFVWMFCPANASFIFGWLESRRTIVTHSRIVMSLLSNHISSWRDQNSSVTWDNPWTSAIECGGVPFSLSEGGQGC